MTLVLKSRENAVQGYNGWKTKAMLYVRWQRLCPPAVADDPERETKAVITAF